MSKAPAKEGGQSQTKKRSKRKAGEEECENSEVAGPVIKRLRSNKSGFSQPDLDQPDIYQSGPKSYTSRFLELVEHFKKGLSQNATYRGHGQLHSRGGWVGNLSGNRQGQKEQKKQEEWEGPWDELEFGLEELFDFDLYYKE